MRNRAADSNVFISIDSFVIFVVHCSPKRSYIGKSIEYLHKQLEEWTKITTNLKTKIESEDR